MPRVESDTILDLDAPGIRGTLSLWSYGLGRPSGNNENGRLCVVLNKSRRKNELIRPLFSQCCFTAKGDQLVTIDEYGNMFGFRVNSGQFQALRKLGSKAHSMSFSPTIDREVVVGLGTRSVVCVDIESIVNDYTMRNDYTVTTLHGHQQVVESISHHPSFNLCVTASKDRLILWNTSKWVSKETLSGASGIVQVAFAPRGDLILVAFLDGTIHGWAVQNLKLVVRLVAKVPLNHPRYSEDSGCCTLTCFCVSTDSRFVLGGGNGPLLFLWELRARTLIRIIELPEVVSRIVQVEFLPDNATAAVLGDDGVIRLIKILGGGACKVLLQLCDETGAFLSFSIAPPEGELLAGCLSNGTLSLHDLRAARKFKQQVQEKVSNMGIAVNTESDKLASFSVFLPSSSVGGGDSPPTKSPSPPSPPLPVSSASPEETDASRADDDDEELSSPPPPQRQELENTSPAQQEYPYMDSEPPLVRLARDLSRDETQLNQSRLGKMLKHFGEFPEKYRTLVWRFLLQLPENTSAYSSLVRKGTHPSWVNLYETYPIRSHKVQGRFERVLYALSHWCPLFEEVSYLPAIVFPFVKLYGLDELSAFETVLMVLFRICGDWFESFPNLPVFALSRVGKLLETTDAGLANHFATLGINAEVYAWPLLRSLFSEVLSREEWLKLWDHILMQIDHGQTLVEVTCVAYLRYFRNTLLSLRKAIDFERFFRRPNPLDIRRLIKTAKKLYKQNESFWKQFQEEGGHEINTGTKLDIIPRGLSYPSFNRYPKFVVDYEAQERRRIQHEEAELLKKQQTVEQVRLKTLALEKHEQETIKRKQHLIDLEEQNRKKKAQEEEQRLKQLEQLDKVTKLRRLQQVEKLEELARDNLKLQQRLQETEAARVSSDLEHRAKLRELELRNRQEEEQLQTLESEAALKLKRIHIQRQLEQEMQEVRVESARLNKQGELDWKLKEEAWRLEDEKHKAQREAKLDQIERDTRIKEISLARRELQAKHAVQQIEAQVKLSAMERQRKARHFQEDSSQQIHETLEQRLELEKLVAQEESRQREEIESQQQHWLTQVAAERERVLERERRAAIEDARERDARIAKLQAAQAKRAFEEEVAKRMRKAKEEAEEEERKLQAQLLKLDDQRRVDAANETELLLKERQLEETTKFMRNARAVEEAAIKSEREKFRKLRVELAQLREEEENRRMKELSTNLEREAAKRHAEVIQQAAAARERAKQAEATLMATE